LEDEPRRPKEGESFYSTIHNTVFIAGCGIGYEKYWIATRKPVKPVKPVVEGWVFLDDKQRSPKKDERYYSNIGQRVLLADSDFQSKSYWIATKVKVEKRPVVEGWAFLEDEPRRPKEGERYYSDISQGVFLANYNLRCNKYWIATKIEAKARKIVRYEIEPNAIGELRLIGRMNGSIDYLCRFPDFIGFEHVDGIIDSNSINYWRPESGIYVFQTTLTEIESGKVEVRHAKFALFFE